MGHWTSVYLGEILTHGRSLSDVQECAQLLGGEQLCKTILGSILAKSGAATATMVGVINLTPYDSWIEKTCHKGFDGITFKNLSITRHLHISQYVEKSLALTLLEDCNSFSHDEIQCQVKV